MAIGSPGSSDVMRDCQTACNARAKFPDSIALQPGYACFSRLLKKDSFYAR